MFNRNEARLRRARKTRAKIAELKAVRLCINRTNCHIYAQVISACGGKVLASASTLETGVRTERMSSSGTRYGNFAAPDIRCCSNTNNW